MQPLPMQPLQVQPLQVQPLPMQPLPMLRGIIMTNSANTSFHTLPKVLSPLYLHTSSLTPAALRSLEPANSRSTARQNLKGLTFQHFQELSTDIYDELMRRKNNSDAKQGSVIVFIKILLHSSHT